MRLDSTLKNVVPNISRPKKSRHFLMKLPDNFQMREHSRPCRFHIIFTNPYYTALAGNMKARAKKDNSF